MSCLIVENSIITNIIEADTEFAASIGALAWYDGASIGDTYDPPTLEEATAQIAQQYTTQSEILETTLNQEYRLSLLEMGITETN